MDGGEFNEGSPWRLRRRSASTCSWSTHADTRSLPFPFRSSRPPFVTEDSRAKCRGLAGLPGRGRTGSGCRSLSLSELSFE